MPVTLKPKTPARVIEVKPDISLSLDGFLLAMDEIDEVLVERTEETEALKLCILTRSHLMLEGAHGIAKSMLADEAFRRITDANYCKIRFMKNIDADQIFGPMNATKYREEAIWEHNTKGMLPESHFFFGDEIYRASDQVLPYMFGILNEREFINGTVHMKCPLITAIGTTNFKTESNELEAFHDRWHVCVDTQPLESPNSVVTMFKRFLDRETNAKDPDNTVSLADIQRLHKEIPKIVFDQEILELFEQLLRSLHKNSGQKYISDRRKCIALKFIQARALIDRRTEVEPEDLEAARYALIKVRSSQEEQIFATVFSATVGQFVAGAKERKNLKIIEKFTSKLVSRFDDEMETVDAQKLWKETKRAIAAIQNQSPDERPQTVEGQNRQQGIVDKLEKLLNSLQSKVAF